MNIKSLLIGLAFIFTACTTTEQSIKQVVEKIPVPPVSDTVLVTHTDTVSIEAVKVVKGDTVIQVKYFPVEKRFYVNVKPDTIVKIHTDTLTTTINRVIETPFMSKVGIFFAGGIILLGVYFVIKLGIIKL